jgi:hypothetical protein
MTDQPAKGIVWLASYQRSGNTWLRIFLAHLLYGGGGELNLNEVSKMLADMPIASNRANFDEIAGIESSELSADDVDRLRPRVYEAIAAAATKVSYIKVHDAYLLTPAGEPLFSPQATRAAVYIVRNPLDVAVSFTFLAGHCNFDLTIAQMANPDRAVSAKSGTLPTQLRQRLSSWSGHVTSWIDAHGLKCHVMRYEDMIRDPVATFTAVVRFLELPHSEAAIGAAIDNLRQAEARDGFVEKPVEAAQFFRAGRIGDWRDHLTVAQATTAISNHRAVMERLGYLNTNGSPKF